MLSVFSVSPQGGAGLVGAEVDLSGRHLERLPTVLFSSLHLTGINLSHNLLAPASSATSSARRRCVGQTRKQRIYRRRAGLPECRDSPGARARSRPSAIDLDTHPRSDKNDGGTGEEEEGLSGDSGVPSDRAEESCQKSDPESLSPKRRSFSEELQDKLRARRAAQEEGCPEKKKASADTRAEETHPQASNSHLPDSSCPAEDVNTSTNVSSASVTSPLTHPLSEPRLPAPLPPQSSRSTDSSSSTSSSKSRWEGAGGSREEGSRGSYEDSSSSGVDESDSGSEAGAAAEGGEVWAASTRSLGALHQLRYFQQLQVCNFLSYSESIQCSYAWPRC